MTSSMKKKKKQIEIEQQNREKEQEIKQIGTHTHMLMKSNFNWPVWCQGMFTRTMLHQQVPFQSGCNPLWLTGLEAPTN